MKMRETPASRRVTVLAQDPSVRDTDGLPLFTTLTIPNDFALPGPRTSRFHIIDYDASLGRFIQPAADPMQDLATAALEGSLASRRKALKQLLLDPNFHAQNTHAIAASTLLEFETALGRHVNWGFESGSHELKIAPHAFADLNAFYSRRDEALVFGYYPKTDQGKDYAFTCLCFDIVVHETTHAILDGLRTEYMQPASADQAAFHEAFADIIAILSVFRSDEIISHGLGNEAGKTISASAFKPAKLRNTFLLGLAKEMGETLGARPTGTMRGDALRRSVNIRPSPELHRSAYDPDNPHAYGEVLVAAILNSFIDIWSRRVEPLDTVRAGLIDRARAVEEGAKAAQHLLRMCIRALDYLPPTNVTFKDYARAIITADFETAPEDDRYHYREALLSSFAGYGIAEPDETVEDLKWGTPDDPENIVYGFDGHAQMQWDRESLYRFLWENLKILELSDKAFTRIISVRPVARLGPTGCVVRETVVEYTQQMNMLSSDLENHNFKRPKGMSGSTYVTLLGGGTLVFDDFGRLKYNIGIDVLAPEQQQRLQALWDAGYFEQRKQFSSRFAETHLHRAVGRRPSRKGEAW